MKMILPLIAIFSLSGCVAIGKPPSAKGDFRPVNSLATAEMLEHDAGYLIVGPQRGEPEVREQLLYKGKLFNARPLDERRQFTRNSDPDEFALVPGAELIERTVVVTFPFASTKFSPDAETALQLRQLFAVADRIEVRGRTDGQGNPIANQKTARRRAEAAKRYLLDRGVPSNIISINYQSAGDYVADDHRRSGRNQNRRVEIEFFVDDFTASRQQRTVDASSLYSDWQEVKGGFR